VSNAGAITTLTNSGRINGGAGAVGGAGVLNAATIGSLTNEASGAISGGRGASSFAPGGAGVLNSNTLTTLTNLGAISGGAGGPGGQGGAGGAGVANSGMISTVTNGGTISGGAGGFGVPTAGSGGAGGAGVANSSTIKTLTNSGKINGGNGGAGFGKGVGGAGGDGVMNAKGATIGSLANLKGGTIAGGAGGKGGAAGKGVYNAGTIGALSNAGTIMGPGYAIYSTGSIGPTTNSGSIVGNVQINNQAKASITGGSGATFGNLRGGTITIGNGSLTFAGGNTHLADNIVVDNGAGTVTNIGLLQLATPEKITGNFAQTASGAFDSLMAGDTAGEVWVAYRHEPRDPRRSARPRPDERLHVRRG
jgi:hypothetical protein